MLKRSKSNLFKRHEAALILGRGFPHQSSGMCRPSEASAEIQTKSGPIVVGGGCNRKLWYRFKGYPQEGDSLPHQIQRANVGKAVEEAVIETAKREGLYVGNNIPFRVVMDEVPIAGEIDAVFRTSPCGGDIYAVEIKSIYGYYATKEAFGRAIKAGKQLGKPKDSYIMQIALYLNHFSRLPEDDPSYIPFGAIFICDRGDGHFGVYDVWLEEETRFLGEDESVQVHRIFYSSDHLGVPRTVLPYTIEDILYRFRTVLSALDGDNPPEQDHILEYNKEQVEKKYEAGLISSSAYKKWVSSHSPKGKGKEKLGDWHCRYCPYTTRCWNL